MARENKKKKKIPKIPKENINNIVTTHQDSFSLLFRNNFPVISFRHGINLGLDEASKASF